MTSLFIDRRGTTVETESGALVFREQGNRIGTVPIAPLSRVFLRGNVQLSASVLGKLGENNTGVIVLSGRQAKPTLFLGRPHNDAKRRVKQIQLSVDDAFCLAIARQLVYKKLAQQIQWFESLKADNTRASYALNQAITHLRSNQKNIPSAKSLASLRGIEGAAAAQYFECLTALVPASFGFTARNRRPPRDPFNVLLSLTYTMLHAEVALALYGAGFDPYVGFYHQLDFGRESLASDMLEPLRPFADQFALSLLREQTLRQDDFSLTESGCLLGKAGRQRYYSAYEGLRESINSNIKQEVTWLTAQLEEVQ